MRLTGLLRLTLVAPAHHFYSQPLILPFIRCKNWWLALALLLETRSSAYTRANKMILTGMESLGRSCRARSL